jgi:four helix bundle protein
MAEGYGRRYTREYLRFLIIAQGSINELKTHLVLSQRVGLSEKKEIETIISLLKEESKMIISLIKKTRKLITVNSSQNTGG